ncbi:MAG: glucose 1-dehydrogenase [Acidobacteria bacterium]|nr:glucose 1-dehydrogenase [Acidobacteriota bacterium]
MAENPFDLTGKIAVAIGGTSGIGQAIALGFARSGATVVASSRRQESVDATANELEALGSKTLRLVSDVQDRASLENLRDRVVEKFGRIDIVLVTAGTLKKEPSADVSEEDWLRVIDINLSGSFRANQIFGRQLIKQGSGVIINTASMTSFVSFAQVCSYNCSKAGVKMLTETLATEWATHGVRVNGVAPGVFRTPLNSKVLDIPERMDAIVKRTPMGRIGTLDEMVGAAVFLASDAAKFVTGVTIPVDGGFLAKGI